MLKRYWISIFLVVAVLTAMPLQAQVSVGEKGDIGSTVDDADGEKAVESPDLLPNQDAITGISNSIMPLQAQLSDGEKGDIGSTVDDADGEKAVESPDLLPIQDAITGISNSINALNDNAPSAEERLQASRDLNAQESMALWSMWMFIVAAASTVLTAVGIILIWRTLIYTRDAAKSAADAVDEARNATAAAESSVLETRRIGEAQVRAYLSIISGTFRIADSAVLIKLNFANTGHSPNLNGQARISIVTQNTKYVPGSAEQLIYFSQEEERWFPSIAPAGETEVEFMMNEKLFDPKALALLHSGDASVYCDCMVQWLDVFEEISTVDARAEQSSNVRTESNGRIYREGTLKGIGASAIFGSSPRASRQSQSEGS